MTSSQEKILKAVFRRVPQTVRVDAAAWAAIYQRSKSQQAATKKRAAQWFHRMCGFLCTDSADFPKC